MLAKTCLLLRFLTLGSKVPCDIQMYDEKQSVSTWQATNLISE